MHPPFGGHPVDLAKCGSLALQSAGHTSPVQADVDHIGVESTAEIEYLSYALTAMDVVDHDAACNTALQLFVRQCAEPGHVLINIVPASIRSIEQSFPHFL